MGLGSSIKKALPGGKWNIFEGMSYAGKDILNWFDGTKAMDHQNDLMRENWQLQNAYNHPAQQMARYKEAGLNPNLIYGQSNTAGSIGTPSAPESGSSVMNKVGSVVSTWFGIKDMKASIANKQAQNALLNSQADYVKEQVAGQAIDNALKRKTLESIGPGGNPNDPWWYRELKKKNPANPVMSKVGSVVGAVEAAPTYTVRLNGKEYTALSEQQVQDLLNADFAARQLEQRRKQRFERREEMKYRR